jgi:diadenosine tetraphosphate (Ap4A) HIT family hydrolase
MRRNDCLSCQTLAGVQQPPGGIIYRDAYWSFFLRPRPLLVPGQGIIVLNRHCERLSELTAEEAQALGPLMQRVEAALDQVLKPARVHFGLYAEAVRHIHLHVLPRMPAMPAGNIPITLLSAWYDLLTRLRLKRAYPDGAVVDLARRLQALLSSAGV